MPELALDHDQRDSLVGHLDGVCVAELMGREPPPDTGSPGDLAELLGCCGCLAMPACGRAVDHAEQRTDWKPCADLEPRVELIPGPAIHADLPPPSTLPTTNENRAAGAVEVGLRECEGFADPQTRSP